MRTALLLALGLSAGCADPVVSMQLQLPSNATMFDTSCVSTVEVRAEGMTFPSDPMDYKSISLPIKTSPPTYAEVEAAIRNQFDVPIPQTGLKAVAIYGWNGPSGWGADPTAPPSDLVFFGRGSYSGDDLLAVPVTPNISCTQQPLVVHTVDLVAFATHGYDCSMATAPDDPSGNSGVSAGTMTPTLFDDTLMFWPSRDGGGFTANVARFSAATIVGPESCFALDGGDTVSQAGSIGCASSGKGVCGTAATDLEMPTIADPYGQNSLDPTLVHQFTGATFGGVFTAAKAPIKGVTIDIDPSVGKVVYTDLDTTNHKFTPTGGSATSTSGLFIIYSSSIADVTVHSGSAKQTVRVGAPSSGPSGLTVVF